jgi:glycosyltransferase involved in cell wall biosynthesis
MIGGGVESTVMNYYRHIDRSRVQFDFVVDADSTTVPREEIRDLGGRVFVVPPYKRLPSYMTSCEKLFREQKPDIVHSNINALSVFPLRAARRAGVPLRIAHSHSTANPREHKKTFLKNALRPLSRVEPTHLAACSDHAARWLFGDAAVDAGRVDIIRNAIDLDEFSFSPEVRVAKRAEIGVHDDQLVVGQVGRMCFQKNQTFTLEVFAQLLRTRPDAVLVFVGDGELMDGVRSRSRDLGVGESVRFLGIRDDVAQLYQAFDVLMFPSTYEGFGMAAVEAQSSGLPVVVSDQVPTEACVVRELVHSLPLTNSQAWVESLMRVEPSRKRDFRSDELAVAGYRIDDAAVALCDWYQSILHDGNGGAR